MRVLLQRVTQASVTVEGAVVGEIGRGLLVFVAVQRGDDELCTDRMATRLLAYRVFSDTAGRMNQDVRAVAGGVLLVSQFTLAADTHQGLRPGFSRAAQPELAKALYERMLGLLREQHAPVACGVFGANMQVSLVNDGPVTFLLES